jgi:hypothetical protein
MLFTVLILFLTALVLTGVAWGGALILQGWLYETPGGDLYWRAPALGVGLAIFYGLWAAVDCGTRGHCGSMYKVSVSTLKTYSQLKAVVKRNGKYSAEETYRKRSHLSDNGFDYVLIGPDGQPTTTRLTETPERIIVEDNGQISVQAESVVGEENGKITSKPPSAREIVFAVPAEARVTIDGKDARLSDSKPGDAVTVVADRSGKVTAVEIAAAAPPRPPPPLAPTATLGKIVKAESGPTSEFTPEKEGKNFKREPGQDLHYYDKTGRTIDEGDLGQVQQFHADWLLWNIVFNGLHLAVWFVGLWLLLRFQWSHALGFAVCLWLVMTLFPLPMLLDFAEKAFLAA